MLYKTIEVWKRIDEQSAVCYRCFEILELRRFVVQSADWYHAPLEDASTKDHATNFVDLFIEEAPEVRSGTFLCLEEAICAFDIEFGNRK